MQLTVKEIAKILKGTVEGNEDAIVWKPSKIEEGEEGSITFLANPKYTHFLYTTHPTAVIVDRKFQPEQPVTATLIRVDNPYMSVALMLHTWNKMNRPPKGRSLRSAIGRGSRLGKGCYLGEYAVVGRNVRIGKNVMIYPQVYVGDNCTIGDNTILYAGVKIYRDCEVGANCIIHSGAVIGADGFGFAPTGDGNYSKIDQIGNVVIEDDVEIGANTCVDRATMGCTRICRGSKIDNLCQLAHNVVIGESTAMAAQSAVAGSGKVGSHCVIAGQVGVVGHITVGDHVTIAAQSGVTRDVKAGSTMLGSPAMDAAKQKKIFIYQRNLEDIVKRLEALERSHEM
ncbi:MAG: UDP-3-O-[3-hydroxymyristoyl] glucosamine N-acyltransferase [bacterium P3]|nr:MAG: UDP-3-O-[3-hydroxymyristoyl] glucosamine N-acyltransferase [bacterium P3]KWW40015.1 MAG: UDP-3-O-[3-hydroxymyristoyl] glucosamine N-acyltransferase [bacterium F083]